MIPLIRMSSHLIGYSVGLTARTLVEIVGGVRRRMTISTTSSNPYGLHKYQDATIRHWMSLPSTLPSEQYICKYADQESEGLDPYPSSTTEQQIPLVHWGDDDSV